MRLRSDFVRVEAGGCDPAVPDVPQGVIGQGWWQRKENQAQQSGPENYRDRRKWYPSQSTNGQPQCDGRGNQDRQRHADPICQIVDQKKGDVSDGEGAKGPQKMQIPKSSEL